MKKLIFVSYIIFTLWNYPAWAENQNSTRSLNNVMNDIGHVMQDIYPLIVAKRAFTARDTEKLDKALARLSTLFHEAEPFIHEKSPGYWISYEFISQYLSVVRDVLKNNDVDYARSHLYALGEICTSCHTQDTALRTLFTDTIRNQSLDDYAVAELDYMTRNYHEASRYYEKFLESPGPKTELEIILPLQRLITIYTQVESKPSEGIIILQKYLSLKQHTPETRLELKNWIRGLQALKADGVTGARPDSFSNLQNYVKKYLGSTEHFPVRLQASAKEEVQRVWLRGQIYHYLNNEPKEDEIPKLLYWLAVVDRSIAYNFYFSLADLYLKQCVLKYPKHPYARRCLEEFKNYAEYSYGREGEEIPPAIQQEITQMQNVLRQNKP